MARPPRAGVAARRSLRIPCTDAEYHSVEAWAASQGLTLADACRLAIMEAAADSGDRAPVVVSEHEISRSRDRRRTAPDSFADDQRDDRACRRAGVRPDMTVGSRRTEVNQRR